MGDQNIIKLSEVGNTSNQKWDEKNRSEIVQIIISYNHISLCSLQFLYYENGNLVLSGLFGKVDKSFDVVKLNYPSEYITAVSGIYISDYGLLSIKFTTNLQTFGPFGLTNDNYANSRRITPLEYNFGFGEGGAFGGFYGSINDNNIITSIGAYVKLPTILSLSKNKGMEQLPESEGKEFDYLFKLLLIGDSSVGKSSIFLRFTSDTFDDLSATVGVDIKFKYVRVGGKSLKLAIWDTAGQERFRTLTSSYYRLAQGIVMVYDVTRRDTFTNLSDIWAKEIDKYTANQNCIKMLVGNKVDKEGNRVVSKMEGKDFAGQYGCLFTECSAKTRVNVEQCFEELILKIVATPSLLSEGSAASNSDIFKQKPPESNASTSSCC